MKKTIFKITLSVLAIAGLSSCLGDTNSTITTTGIAYITETEYGIKKIAVVPGYPYGYQVSSSVIDAGLYTEDCAFVRFKISLDKMGSDGVYPAEEFEILETYARSSQPVLVSAPAPVVLEKDTLVAFSTFTTSAITFVATKDWGDRWAMSYSTPLTKDQESKLQFFYDKENGQVDKEGKPIDTDKQAVVDVRLTKTTPGDGATTASAQTTVAQFRELRRQILDYIEVSKEGTTKDVIFRYYVLEKDKGVSKTVMKYEKVGIMHKPGSVD